MNSLCKLSHESFEWFLLFWTIYHRLNYFRDNVSDIHILFIWSKSNFLLIELKQTVEGLRLPEIEKFLRLSNFGLCLNIINLNLFIDSFWSVTYIASSYTVWLTLLSNLKLQTSRTITMISNATKESFFNYQMINLLLNLVY